MTSRGNRVSALALLAVVLGCGAGIGIAVERLWLGAGKAPTPRSDTQRVARLLERFRKELGLDAAQASQAGEVLTRGRAAMAAILERQQPELRAARQKTRDELSSLLTPAQRSRYEALVKAHDERRAREKAQQAQASP